MDVLAVNSTYCNKKTVHSFGSGFCFSILSSTLAGLVIILKRNEWNLSIVLTTFRNSMAFLFFKGNLPLFSLKMWWLWCFFPKKVLVYNSQSIVFCLGFAHVSCGWLPVHLSTWAYFWQPTGTHCLKKKKATSNFFSRKMWWLLSSFYRKGPFVQLTMELCLLSQCEQNSLQKKHGFGYLFGPNFRAALHT